MSDRPHSCDPKEGNLASLPAGHEHVWQPNGIVESDRVVRSPVSSLDDTLYTRQYSVLVCACGKTKTVAIADKNVRRRGDRKNR